MSAQTADAPENAFATGAPARLTIVVEESFPPFVHAEDGRAVGLAIEALDAAARLAGVELEYIPAPASSVQAIIAAGRAQAAFPLAVNAERLAVFDFSEPVLTTGGGFFVAAPSPSPSDLESLRGKTVATPATGPLAAFLRANAPETALLLTKDYIEPLRMVVSGQADAAALNLEAGTLLAGQHFSGRITTPADHFLKLPLALGMSKLCPEKRPVLERLNDAIKSSGDAAGKRPQAQ
ncbi:transporter substrate-binding domain-containing protein [Shinella sp. CPCC 100929]|uniref:Transporter substrate-binding domain-containing protein n=1 Tax=Shinella lacus TaxID=2654216 RepID=A0ABT1RHL0_9HYPH|nr:transporter substrate-binding domain-containing protein [Shinella lacus]MCQ4634662.1 transporter substrate-binding domain-containing protein [Shinella lacus]